MSFHKLAIIFPLLFLSASPASASKKSVRTTKGEIVKALPRHGKKSARIAPAPLNSFQLVLALLERKGAKFLMETGVAPGWFGDSINIFEDWAFAHEASFFSTVDRTLAAVSQQHPSNFDVFVDFETVLDFLYLGSDDYDQNDPLPFQKHYLQEISDNYYPSFGPNAIVMVDGCDLPGGGAGKLVIEYLVEKGWKSILKGPQAILVRS